MNIGQGLPYPLIIGTPEGGRELWITGNEWIILFSTVIFLENGEIIGKEELCKGFRRRMHNKL